MSKRERKGGVRKQVDDHTPHPGTTAVPIESPAPPVDLLRMVLVVCALAVVGGLLAVAFVIALPDAVDKQRQGRVNRIHALCDETLRPTPVNAALGGFPTDAPDFTLADFAGRNVTLSSLRGRAVLVNFWFTKCEPCVVEVPSFEKLAVAEKKRPFTMLAVSVDEDWPTVRSFFHEGTPLTVLLDADKKVPARYGTDKFPETFVIDKDGKVLYYVVSDRDWSSPAMKACIDAIAD